MKYLLAISFGLFAGFGLNLILIFSPIGLITQNKEKLFLSFGTEMLHFAIPALLVSFVLGKKVLGSKDGKHAFLWGAIITAVTACISGVSSAIGSGVKGEFLLVAPFLFLALDVFLVSPFLAGGFLGFIFWKWQKTITN